MGYSPLVFQVIDIIAKPNLLLWKFFESVPAFFHEANPVTMGLFGICIKRAGNKQQNFKI